MCEGEHFISSNCDAANDNSFVKHIRCVYSCTRNNTREGTNYVQGAHKTRIFRMNILAHTNRLQIVR